MMRRHLYLLVSILLFSLSSLAQFDRLKKDIAITDSLNTYFPREKLFIHQDRTWYLINDTIWMKGYILSAKDLAASDSSRIAYIEIIDAAGKSVKHTSTYALAGIFFANITLHQADFRQGTYLVRAWTNYMRNYGDSLFFQSSFKIINPGSKDWEPVSTLQSRNINNQEIKERLQPQTDAKPPDIQFLPEGGSFIVNKKQRIGFKVLDVFGKGVNVAGRIENSKKQLITTFQCERNGMGVFWITPEPNEKYIAVLDNGRIVELPLAKSTGTILQINNEFNADSVEVVVDASPDQHNKNYFFRASAMGISCAFGTMRLQGTAWHKTISKKAFPSGIARFTLYDSKQLSVNERIIFIWHNDTIQLSLAANKPGFSKRDSVAILLSSKSNNQPIQGSFSVAVIDTGRVPFEKNAQNILSYMLLSADLKGNIEEPGYYTHAPGSKATDALMLTQGWVSYERFFVKPVYAYEQQFNIKGKVTNILNRAVPNSQMTVFGKDGKLNSFFIESKTDKDGKFLISDFPVFTSDTVGMVIKALNRGGKSFGIGVELEEPVLPVFRYKPQPVLQQNIIHDTTAMYYLKKEIEGKGFGKEYLAEVIVTARARIKGSHNLNEDGGSDQVITEKVLETMPKETLLQVLIKEIKGFHRGQWPRSNYQAYRINNDIAVFVIDGYNVSMYYEPTTPGFMDYVQYIDTYLNYINAEDVAGIEVLKSSKHSNAYEQAFSRDHISPANTRMRYESGPMLKFSFIEITTHSGHGAFMKKIPGMYLYNPLAPVLAKSFYAPKYNTTDSSTAPDFRSTVFWKPDIITDKNGEARFSFYTSDSNSGYMIIAQGADLTGKLGITFLPLYIRRDDKTANK